MNFRHKGLVAAMEAQDDVMIGDDTVPAADSAESSMLEMAESEQEVTDGLDAIDSAESDSGDLAAIADVMETSVENGGMDETSAKLAEVAVESIYARMGVTKVKAMPSMESFGAKGNRVAATKVALETIKEQLKNIWDAIIAAIQKMTNWIKTFFAKLFDANLKLGKRAGELKTMVDGITVDKGKNATIPAGSFGKSLATGGKLNTDGLIATMDTLEKDVKASGNQVGVINSFLSQSAKLTEAVTTKEAFNTLSYFTLKKENYKQVGVAEGFNAAKDNIGQFRSEELPGNRAIIMDCAVDQNVTGEEAVKAILATKFRVGMFNSKAAKTEIEVLPTLSKANMEKIVAVVSETSKAVEGNKKIVNELEKARDAFVAEIKKLKTAATEDKTVGARAGKIQKLATALNRISTEAVTTINSVAVSVSKSALDYVEKSAKEYKAA